MKEVQSHEDYIEGFNKGYIIREYKPNLALSLSQTKFADTELGFGQGLKDGIKQKELEIIRERNNHFQNDQNLDRER